MPVAFATSDGAEWRNALGALLIGGLTSSTLLTLIVVPAFFMMLSDVASILARLRRRLLWPFIRLNRKDGEDSQMKAFATGDEEHVPTASHT